MRYKVILTKNGVYKKTLWRCKKRTTVFNNFHRIKDENKVFFDRRFINFKGIKPVTYMIHAVKEYEETDKKRLIRNHLGQMVEEGAVFGHHTVLKECKYDVEEYFWVFGFNPLTERKNIIDIIGILMGDVNDKLNKQIIVINNKLVFYNEDSFDMVICKCKKDAQRLHHTLSKAALDNGFNNLYFMGTITDKKIMGDYYEIIHEKTKWSYTKIWRTTTRP